MNPLSLENRSEESSFIYLSFPKHFFNSLFKKIQQICQKIFLGIASLLKSNEKIDLEKCIQALKTIPFLSQEHRMNWQSWYRLHIAALDAFTFFRIPGLSVNFKIQLPWHPMQVRINQFMTHPGLRTSCGVTQRIALTKLLGAKDAAWLSRFGKSNQLGDLHSILRNHKPLLLAFNIEPCDLAVEEGSSVPYGGHAWTVFQANPDRYLMITSYLHKQNSVVMELNDKEMLAHIKDIHMISNAENWTEKVDGVYKKWFGVSHCELIGLNSIQEKFKRPWQVTFKSVQPNIRNVNRIQDQFCQSLLLPCFPKRTVLEKGEKIPIDDVEIQKIFNQGNKYWWFESSQTISLKEAIYDYFSWI